MSGSRMKFVNGESHNKNQRWRWKMTKNICPNLMQAVGIYGLAGYLWEGRVPYYQAQVEIKRMVLSMGLNCSMWEFKRRTAKHLTSIVPQNGLFLSPDRFSSPDGKYLVVSFKSNVSKIQTGEFPHISWLVTETLMGFNGIAKSQVIFTQVPQATLPD